MIRLGLALLATLVLVPAAGAADRAVTMPGTFFSPARTVAVVGDTVTWTNQDFTKNHTVTFFDGSLDSGPLPRGGTATRAFPAVGSYAYHCTIHPTMQGRVDVFDLWLTGPRQPVAYGRRAVLTALAPGGTAQVNLEKRQADGSFLPFGSPQAPGAGGSASFVFPATLPGAFRATTASGTASRTVKLAVRARVALSARKTGAHAFRLKASVKPVLKRAQVALQRKVGSSWKTIARSRLDAHSAARFSIVSAKSQRFRVVMTHGAAGFSPGKSRSLRVGG
jgi:plastocyanin